jgi:acyl-coenzyme A synthetase/AMP-(fatty) acid ligase
MALAAELSRMGFRKGDFLAASLPLLNEHILLEYACFRLGVIHAPLDLRLQPAEVLRCLGLIRARGYAFPGRIAGVDFAALVEAARRSCDSIEHWIQFAPPGESIAGAVSFADVMARAASGAAPVPSDVTSPPVPPDRPNPRCFPTAESPARICAWAGLSISRRISACSAICRRRTWAARPKCS